MSMKNFSLKYHTGSVNFSIPEENLLGEIHSRAVPCAPTEEAAVKEALGHPIDSLKLDEIVKTGEKVCIVVADVTRAWQRGFVYLPILVNELNQLGIRDEDILFLSATGTHRAQSDEEHIRMIGEELFKRIKIVDHDCDDENNLVYIGTTSHGTPVKVNKLILQYDRVIITGGIVYHFMAGWGGGRKAIIPGISARSTISANHRLALDPMPGKGRNLLVTSGNFAGNVLHDDMTEALRMVMPSFLLNVMLNAEGKIGWAVAGDPVKAHLAGTKIVDQVDGVPIPQRADLVIASAGGFPKDINLYQGSKTILNAWEAVKDGGSMICLITCGERFGSEECRMMLQDFHTMADREAEMRRDFTIGKYIGYVIADVGAHHDVYLMCDIPAAELADTGLQVVSSVEEALAKIYAKHGSKLTTWIMPKGGNTRPIAVK